MRGLYFSESQGRGLSVEAILEYLLKNQVDVIAMSFFSFEGIPAYSALLRGGEKLSSDQLEMRVADIMTVIRLFLSALRDKTSVPFLIHDASGLPLTRVRSISHVRLGISSQSQENAVTS